MAAIATATAFHNAAAEFSARAKDGGADLIGHAHLLYFSFARMSGAHIALEIESIRAALVGLNAAFARLDHAHAAMTTGEVASRIRQAAERK